MTVNDVPVGRVFTLPHCGLKARKVNEADPANPEYCSAEALDTKGLWHVPLVQPVEGMERIGPEFL